jgi:hypothetical protein
MRDFYHLQFLYHHFLNSYNFFYCFHVFIAMKYNKLFFGDLSLSYLFMCLFIFLHLSNLLINNGIAMSIINNNKKIRQIWL